MRKWLIPGTDTQLTNVHAETADCADGCMIHNPSVESIANRDQWPYAWRPYKHVMERACPHGIGHPDPDEANYQRRIGRDYMNIHGCDGCCRE